MLTKKNGNSLTLAAASRRRVAIVILSISLGAHAFAGSSADRPAAPAMPGLGFSLDADGRWSGANAAHRLTMTAAADRLQLSIDARAAQRTSRLSFRLEGWGRSAPGTEGLEASPAWLADGSKLQLDHGAIVEWFDNGRRGLEHGFTIRSRPDRAGDGPLRLQVGLDTDLVPDLAADGLAIRFRAPAGAVVLHYNKLFVTDAAERRLDARMEFVGAKLHFVVDDEHAVYPIVIDPLLTSIGWEEMENDADRFGLRVGTFGDIDGDGFSDVYVFDDDQIRWWGGSSSGPVKKVSINYDFGTFTEIGDVDGDGIDDMIECSPNGAITTHHGTTSGDFSQGTSFDAGWTVGRWCGPAGDVNGDGHPDMWAVGAFGSSNVADYSTWIYHGDGQDGFQTPPATELPVAVSQEAFGVQLLITSFAAGDVNGDGYDDLLTGTNSGMQLYLGSSSGLATTADWSVAGHGFSVAIPGDLNCDGYPDMVGTSVDTGYQGADDAELYIYTGSSGPFSTFPYATVTGYQGTFIDSWGGLQVAPAGDVNGDGCADLLVGEPEYTYWSGDQRRGRASVWYGRQTLYLAASDDDADWIYVDTLSSLDNDELGWSVSAAGDVDMDGYGDILISAPGFENQNNDDGRVLLFYGSAETLEPATSRTWRSSQANDQLGTTAELLGDLNGDGFSDVIVGVPGFDGAAGNGTGRAYLFYGGSGTPNIGVDFIWEGEAANDSFGFAVNGAGDVNGDGYEDVIIGAPNADGSGAGHGKIYLYFGGPSGPSSTPATVIVGTSAGDALGWSVASAGDVDRDGFGDVIVGAPFRSVHGTDGAGCFYIRYGTSTGLHPTRKATLCGNQFYGNYGWSVASGDFNRDGFSDVAVGEPFSSYNGYLYNGRVDVFLGRAIGISISPVRSLYGTQTDQFYGNALSSAGDVNNDRYSDLIIGAYGHTNGQNDEGYAEVRLGHSSLGVNTAIALELNVTDARFGSSVDSAGDVNGDFYGDIVVGAPGDGTRGKAYVFHGSSSGVSTTAARVVEGTQSGEYFGNWVSAAGDMDGDGYGDVIVSSPLYNFSGSTDSGQVSFFAGNGDRAVVGNAVRQMYEDLSEPIARLGRANSDDSFAIDMRTYHPAGKIDVVLQHQVRRLVEWYGSSVADGTSAPITSGFTRAVEGIFNLNEQDLYKWRVRLKGDRPAFKYGRWFTMPGRGIQETSLQTDGCRDSDNDGYGYPGGPDCPGGVVFDNCPTDYNPTQANNDGDSLGDACDSDDDNDGVTDVADNCPFDANNNQADFDGDGIGDVCDPSSDLDADGVLDGADNCMTVPNPAQADLDADGFGDACDNCPEVAQPDQIDVDADGFGAACDCADADVDVWSTPTPVDSVTVDYFPASGQTLVQWGSPTDLGGSGAQASGLGFDLLASGDPSDFVGAAVCVVSNAAYNVHAASFADAGLPPGALEYYLVRAQNSCGEGSAGLTDQGAERPAMTCP